MPLPSFHQTSPEGVEAAFIQAFQRIRDKGFLPSHRLHNTGIGKTFEDHLEVIENNTPGPDFGHIEVKTQRALTGSYITLFTKSPDFPAGANRMLRDRFGTLVEAYGVRKLHTSFFAHRPNSLRGEYAFQLVLDDVGERLHIRVVRLDTGEVETTEPYWNYATLQSSLETKLGHVAVIGATTRREGEMEYFHFNHLRLLRSKGFDTFLRLVREGIVMFDIRIGFYKSGPSLGNPHDHGSGFRIRKGDLSLLFDTVYEE
ncbi:MAG: MvaI/BcnI restriction endonuclease family protein [Rhodothermales bacterium]|nr:MvaI/BcnI restriction endonuclease family protein [Rhodothermales bacterium]